MSDDLEKVRAEDQQDFEAHRTPRLSPSEKKLDTVEKKLGVDKVKGADDDFEGHRTPRLSPSERKLDASDRKLGATRPKGTDDDFEGHAVRLTGADARLTDPDAPLR